MRARTVALALLAGIAVFLVAGVAATELAAARIEFSVFVGIPVGIVAGLATAAFVLARAGDPDRARRRPALAVGGFGVGFVAALLAGTGAGLPIVSSLVAALAVGVIAGTATYLRLSGQ